VDQVTEIFDIQATCDKCDFQTPWLTIHPERTHDGTQPNLAYTMSAAYEHSLANKNHAVQIKTRDYKKEEK